MEVYPTGEKCNEIMDNPVFLKAWWRHYGESTCWRNGPGMTDFWGMFVCWCWPSGVVMCIDTVTTLADEKEQEESEMHWYPIDAMVAEVEIVPYVINISNWMARTDFINWRIGEAWSVSLQHIWSLRKSDISLKAEDGISVQGQRSLALCANVGHQRLEWCQPTLTGAGKL